MSNEKPTTYELISWAYEDYKQAQNQPKPGGYEPPKKPKVIKDKDTWERYQGELEGWRNHQAWYSGEMERIQTDIKRAREHLINAIPACGVWFKMADGMCVGKYVVVEWKLFTGRAEHDELVVRSYQKHMPTWFYIERRWDGDNNMSQLLKQKFSCNFCNREAEHPERWFRVISYPLLVYGNQKPARMVDLEARCNTHACNSCGWAIHRFLNVLGIKHDFSSVPMDGEPWTWGRILIP